MTYGLYLFDLDGTLIDSIALILESFHHTRFVHFGDRLADEYYLQTLGMPLREAFRSDDTGTERAEAMVRTYVEYNLARHDDMVRAYPGVADTIEQLADRGARLGIVTSKMRAHAERGLRVAGLRDAFDVIVSADDVTHGKPHPEPVLIALERFAGSTDETIFVGDSPHDILAGNGAHVGTAAALWGPFPRAALVRAHPTHWLERPQDVLSL